MTSRINFDVDDETKVKIDDVMAATGISTKRRLSDWRSTPWIKGTRVHVSDVIAMLAADPELTSDEIAQDLKVPAEAVSECLAYAGANKALIEAEERETTLRSEHRGDHAPAT